MKTTLSLFSICCVILLSGGVAQADLAPPPEKPGKIVMHTSFAVVPDEKTGQAKLQISAATLAELRAAINNLPDDTNAGVTSNSNRTIIAGISLFAALSFGGVWWFRSGNRTQRKAAVLLIGIGLLGAAAIITRGNAGPPPTVRWRPLTKNLAEGRVTHASLDVEIMPEGHGMKLILPLKKEAASK